MMFQSSPTVALSVPDVLLSVYRIQGLSLKNVWLDLSMTFFDWQWLSVHNVAMSSSDHCTVYQWCCGLVKTTLVLVTVLDTVLALGLKCQVLQIYFMKIKDTNMKGFLTFQDHLGDLKTNLLSVDQ